jgi:hypothetical protein
MTDEQHAVDSLDEELIRARGMPIECVLVAHNAGQQTCLSLPAPKVWHRSLKKQACFTPSDDATILHAANDRDCAAPIYEIPASDMDEWTRDFLMLAEVNEN